MRYFADYIKGKPYQKTVLWENSSPSSVFTAQNVTLNDAVTNYDMIRFVYKSNYTDSVTKYIDVPVKDLTSSGYERKLGIYTYYVSWDACRWVSYVNSTTIGFGTSYKLNTSGSDSGLGVPIKIIGIKKGLGEVKNVETINVDAVRNDKFTAIVGHRYIIAFASLYGESGSPTDHITGLEVIAKSTLGKTETYSSLTTTLQIVIGIATDTTVSCSHRTSSPTRFCEICAIDLDDQ